MLSALEEYQGFSMKRERFPEQQRWHTVMAEPNLKEICMTDCIGGTGLVPHVPSSS